MISTIRDIFIALLFTAVSGISAQPADRNVIDSTGLYGCWLSAQSQSEESIHDSLYNSIYYHVQFTMCLDEYYNIEINKKIKNDCCIEDTYNFKYDYRLVNDTIIIYITESGITERYKYNINDKTLLLTPINSLKSDSVNRPMLKYRWTRY